MRVRYVLETLGPNKQKNGPGNGAPGPSRVIVPLVSEVQFYEPSGAVLSWNFGETPTRHLSPPRARQISVSGQSGVAPRFETEGVTAISASDMSGPALFKRFVKFITDYKINAAKAIRLNEVPPVLVFRALWEGVAYYVEPGDLSWSRSISGPSRHGYMWSLTLDVYRHTEVQEPRGVARVLEGASRVAGLASRAVNEASVQVATATEFLRDVDTELDSYREPLRAAYRLGMEVRKFNRSVSSINQFPKEFMQDFWWASAELSANVYETWATKPFTAREAGRNKYVKVQAAISRGKGATKAALGLTFNNLPSAVNTYENGSGTIFSATSKALAFSQNTGTLVSSTVNGQPVIVYETKSGDTLQSVAQNIMGDATKWTVIAEINEYTTTLTNEGNVLLAGVKLLVPFSAGTPLSGLDADSIYDVDIKLDDTGDFVGAGEYPKDISIVRGIDNLLQGLRIRFLTVQGSNQTFPDLGLPRLVGEAGTASLFADAVIEVAAQFGRDRRIASVADVNVFDQGDTLAASAKLQPVIGSQFPATVPFPSRG